MCNNGGVETDAPLPDEKMLFTSTNGLKVEALQESERPAGLRMMTDYIQECYKKSHDGTANAAMKKGWAMIREGWMSRGVPLSVDGNACVMAYSDRQTLYGDARYVVIQYDIRHPDNGGSEKFIIEVMVFNDGQTRFDRSISYTLADSGYEGKQAHMKLYVETGRIANGIMDALDVLPLRINPKGL